MMVDNQEEFKGLVQESLRRHVDAVNKLAKKGMKFWDYGNSLYDKLSFLSLFFSSPLSSPLSFFFFFFLLTPLLIFTAVC